MGISNVNKLVCLFVENWPFSSALALIQDCFYAIWDTLDQCFYSISHKFWRCAQTILFRQSKWKLWRPCLRYVHASPKELVLDYKKYMTVSGIIIGSGLLGHNVQLHQDAIHREGSRSANFIGSAIPSLLSVLFFCHSSSIPSISERRYQDFGSKWQRCNRWFFEL